jgi:oxygen-independent coproporphyrinogen-3 oxidase
MAGIYLHIPFCKQACHYCNFHFSTSLKQKDDMVNAILTELELRKDYLESEPIETIYLGGGTPSLLNPSDLNLIFDKIYTLFSLIPPSSSLIPRPSSLIPPSSLLIPEITLEANPDDLTPLKINELKQTPVNRLSIGIQSFSEEDLRFFNRAHTAAESVACIENALAAGFENLTLDLIYGSPTTSDEQWERNLATVFKFGVPHLSCYCLTVEEKTALADFIRKGKALPVDEEKAARQFEIMVTHTLSAGYEHYEISNFAKPGWYSRHNTSYWQGKKYLGVGPAAHSFDGVSRQWNVANNAHYLRAIRTGVVPFEKEILTPEQRYNEYVMTSLRTIWGCNLETIRQMGGQFEAHFSQIILPFLRNQTVEKAGDWFFLTRTGKLLADRIAMELFFDA